MSKTFNGIDVSAWQGSIDWDKAGAEIDFAIIRLGYGKNTVDKCAERNISELNRLGIPYGVYWYSYAYTVDMARNEAKSALAYLEKLGAKPSYPVYFDWEYDSRDYAKKNGVTVSNALLRDMATAFCEAVRSDGYYPGIYANPDYINSYYGEDIFKTYDLWLAHYVSSQSRDVKLWQHSETGKVAGISGNVDVNRCYVDYPAIIAGQKEEAAEEPKADAVLTMRNLSKGCKGEDVRALQILLIGRGYTCGKYGADGDFGSATDSAVRNYQLDHGLDVDGIAGPATMGSLLGLD